MKQYVCPEVKPSVNGTLEGVFASRGNGGGQHQGNGGGHHHGNGGCGQQKPSLSGFCSGRRS